MIFICSSKIIQMRSTSFSSDDQSVVGVSAHDQGVKDGVSLIEKTYSMECTALSVRIINTRSVAPSSSSRSHTVYRIEVAPSIRSWTVERRFSDFVYLARQLSKSCVGISLPQLPPKRLLGSSIDPKFVEDRKQQLNSYLQKLVAIPNVWDNTDLVRFLDNESNAMMFIWNLDRMRKMKDVRRINLPASSVFGFIDIF